MMLSQVSAVPISENARSVQLDASRREDHSPEVRLAAVAQGAAYCCQGLDCHGHESGI
jgi:hypothetical protein